MLTRCPKCATTFRITSEQLKARQGRVRCGACQEVFSALDTLIEEVLPQPAVAAATAPVESPPEHASPLAPDAEAVELVVDQEPEVAAVAEPDIVPATDAEPELPPAADGEVLLVDEPLAAPEPLVEPEAEATTATAVAPEPTTTTELASEPVLESPVEPAPEAPSASWPEPEPLLHEEAPRRKWPWAVGIGVAALLLVAQAAIAFRTELAVLYPEAKPALVTVCAAVGCELKLPRKAELVGIETSDLHPDAGGRLALVATLKNRAPFAQEYPHLELTLTDTGDQPLVRRVLTPTEYMKPKAPGDAGFGANAEIAVSLAVEAPGVPAAGYRLYLFYP